MTSRLRTSLMATGGLVAAGLLAGGSMPETLLATARAQPATLAETAIRVEGNRRIEHGWELRLTGPEG